MPRDIGLGLGKSVAEGVLAISSWEPGLREERSACRFAFLKIFFAKSPALLNPAEKFGAGSQKTRRPEQESQKEFPRWKQREQGFPQIPPSNAWDEPPQEESNKREKASKVGKTTAEGFVFP